tara:strand:+ start:122 stop:580 length:459 start_codon:yes stop_codon:yes gene_type:complete
MKSKTKKTNINAGNQLDFDIISESFHSTACEEIQVKERKPNGNKGFMKIDRFCRKHKFCRSTLYKYARNGTIPKSKLLPPTKYSRTIRIHKSAIENLENAGIKSRYKSQSKKTNEVKKIMNMPDELLINTVNKYGLENMLNLLCKIEGNNNE